MLRIGAGKSIIRWIISPHVSIRLFFLLDDTSRREVSCIMNIAQLLHGNVETLVLKILSEKALHVYGIKKMLYEHSDGYLGLAEGRLYPLLKELERHKLVRGRNTTSDTKRKVRKYTLTRTGQKELDTRLQAWKTFANKMNNILLA